MRYEYEKVCLLFVKRCENRIDVQSIYDRKQWILFHNNNENVISFVLKLIKVDSYINEQIVAQLPPLKCDIYLL